MLIEQFKDSLTISWQKAFSIRHVRHQCNDSNTIVRYSVQSYLNDRLFEGISVKWCNDPCASLTDTSFVHISFFSEFLEQSYERKMKMNVLLQSDMTLLRDVTSLSSAAAHNLLVCAQVLN